jgi:hypothetical protein
MSGASDLVKSQLASVGAARAADTSPAKPAVSPAEFMGIALKPGTRVLDKITGQEGTVIAGTIKHTILPTS